MKKCMFLLLFTCYLSSQAQHIGLTIRDAEQRGITISHLDSLYQSAVHSDTAKAVFRSDSAQAEVIKAYTKLLNDFGSFLHKNKFNWEYPTRCWNRIYFDSTGSIDYFLYNFLTKGVKSETLLSPEKQAEFNRLLNIFIRDYRFALSAKVRFAQCSPTTYMPADKK